MTNRYADNNRDSRMPGSGNKCQHSASAVAKKRQFLKPMLVGASSALMLAMAFPSVSWAQFVTRSTSSDAELRGIAPGALEESAIPSIDVSPYVANNDWLELLGKAFFWDVQAGGDGLTACASCHFHAGADSRSINMISPGLNDTTPGVDVTLFSTAFDNGGGPNSQLTVNDFPIDKAINDVVSSMGVYLREFDGFSVGGDACSSVMDSTFHKGGLNTRRVEPRNTPTVINASLFDRLFWDGRANNEFNGVDPLGPRTFLMAGGDAKGIWFEPSRRAPLELQQPLIKNSALASQAVGPTGSAFEMSCGDLRTMPDLGVKLIRVRALQGQAIAADDSLFGSANSALGSQVHSSGIGLTQTYASLIRRAFNRSYWGSRNRVNIDGKDYSQMEANFALFWGLAVQAYERTLFSNQTPFDSWANGDNSAMTNQQKIGLEVFLDNDRGKCANCHAGPEFTGALARIRGGSSGEAVERMIMGDNGVALYDGGFYNIGVTGTLEDLGVGANIGTLDGVPIPLSFSRQLTVGPLVDNFNHTPVTDEEGVEPGPAIQGERVAVDGAMKVPTIRNTELTAPYFHDGGHATLKQVTEFYWDQGRRFFSEDNIADLDPDILEIDFNNVVRDSGTHSRERILGEVDALVAFMKALTDERVRLQQAPFDHPAIDVPNGHTEPVTANPGFPFEAKTEFISIPAVGAGGLSTPPTNFLE